MTDTRIGFLGAGNMASALIAGLIDAGFAVDKLAAADIDPEARQRVQQSYGIASFASSQELVDAVDMVVLALKPQVLPDVLEGLRWPAGVGLVSVAAGTRLARIFATLGCEPPAIRAMPNTPALVGKGVTGLFCGDRKTAHAAVAERIFASVGETIWFDEEAMLDAVTAVSGSGPAYLFTFVESLAEAAQAQGISRADARVLAQQTVLGACVLLEKSNLRPDQLRVQVTSPGGTTEAALAILQNELGGLMQAAVRAATNRAKELSS